MELFKKTIDDYNDIGGGFLSLTPTVGDIFLDSKLKDRLRYIKSINSIKGLSVTTNAVLAQKMPREDLEFILSNFSRIHISIYGLDSEEYLLMTQKDKYNEMVESVALIIELCKNTDKVVFGFRLLNNRSDDEVRSWIYKNFLSNIPFQIVTKFSNWGVLDTSKNLPGDAAWVPVSTNKGQCAIPLMAMQVSFNGDVSFCPCSDFKHLEELKLGNIAQLSLREMYNSEKVKNLYNFESHMPKFCQNCSFHMSIKNLSQIESMISDPLVFIGG
jgi:radical SAM protein with 4Fe4S-binding SPASM domain